MATSLTDNRLITVELETNRRDESVRVHHPSWLEGVSFWTVEHSMRHWSMLHDTFTVSYVDGPRTTMRARWHSRGVEREVSSGCLQLMNPGETHRTTAVSEPASFLVVWWSPGAMNAAARELGAGRDAVFERAQLERSDAGYAFQRLRSALRAGADALEVEQWHVESTARLLRASAEPNGREARAGWRHPNVRRAIEYLRTRAAANVTLDELAREAELSKFHLARCFRDATGHAPHQYLKLLRLQMARRLLESGVSVQQAAAEAGFADAPHLARAFRVWLGVPPSHWARASRAASLA